MPRSGTSLIEQILSSHSNVYGAGEIPFLKMEINKKFNFYKNNNINILDEVDKLAEISAKYEYAKNENLNGVGIWALGYDEGHDELWGSIEYHFSYSILGDLNFDNILNIQDIILLVNIILGISDSNLNADFNNDNSINILDIVILIDWIFQA